jgi:hypothetical protein
VDAPRECREACVHALKRVGNIIGFQKENSKCSKRDVCHRGASSLPHASEHPGSMTRAFCAVVISQPPGMPVAALVRTLLPISVVVRVCVRCCGVVVEELVSEKVEPRRRAGRLRRL